MFKSAYSDVGLVKRRLLLGFYLYLKSVYMIIDVINVTL